MNKSYTPVSIPTFSDGESMDDVRVKTINPLTAETSRLGSHMDSLSKTSIKHEGTINSHSVKIAALEAGGGSGGPVDLGPVLSRVQKNEVDIDNLEILTTQIDNDQITMKGQITTHGTKIAALEAGGPGGGGGSTTFTGLTDTPSTLQADKFVKVNAAGNALEFVASSGGGGSTTFKDLTDTPSVLTPNHFLKVNAAGTALELDAHTHQKVDGRQIMYSWNADDLPATGAKTIAKDKVAQRSFFISAAGNAGNDVTFMLPDIADEGVEPNATSVNGGRLTIFANTGASKFILTAPGSLKVQSGPSVGAVSITVGPGKFVHVMAVCRANNGYKNYHVVAAGDTAGFA